MPNRKEPTPAPTHRPGPEERRAREIDVFIDEVTAQIGLQRDEADQNSPREPFQGPAGLICRIHAEHIGRDLRARPELLLPLDQDQIRRLEVSQLLSIQSVLLQQLGWMLGASSEGLLQLAPMHWTDEAREVARELELGSTVGRMVLNLLGDSPAKGLKGDDTGDSSPPA